MLTNGLDPCREKGEFHSFVCAGPMLNEDIPVSLGEIVVHDQFVLVDLTIASTLAGFSSKSI
jgi:diphthamide synthase (EF-2-diphthine--ammonia ligase)